MRGAFSTSPAIVYAFERPHFGAFLPQFQNSFTVPRQSPLEEAKSLPR